MYKNRNTTRNGFFSLTFAVAFLIAPSSSWADDCQSALSSTTGFTALANGGTSSTEKRVDEWDGEVVKIRTSRPGVLTVAGVGAGSQSSLYTSSNSGPHPLVDRAQLGNDLRELQAVVPAGDHCIAVAPPSGVTGDFTIEASFTDICHLEGMDDHGDSFLCATELTIGESTSGEIENSGNANDVDMFTFKLTSAETVSIASTGSTDVAASLYDEDGELLDSDDNSGASPNFEIVQSLGAGRYYVRVAGTGTAQGSYAVEVSPVP